jgi:hypothetical protein
MSRRLVLTAAALAVAGSAALAAPAFADPVTVTNDGGCRHVYLQSGKEVTPSNGLCYLGPPPIGVR